MHIFMYLIIHQVRNVAVKKLKGLSYATWYLELSFSVQQGVWECLEQVMNREQPNSMQSTRDTTAEVNKLRKSENQ